MEYEGFKSFGKITRENPFIGTITEKIDGTNACVIVKDSNIVGVQSRKQLITPENDNFGFATWVNENNGDLITLGDGYHYGEWAGPGIQKNPLNLPQKEFFLFNTFRETFPACCSQVPILFQGKISQDEIEKQLDRLKADTSVTHEGVVVYYHALRSYTKHTLISPNGKWCK